MTVPHVKPYEFMTASTGDVEIIPYVEGFDYDGLDYDLDEIVLFGTDAWINYDDIVFGVPDVSVYFSLAALLDQSIAQIDAEPMPADKASLINHLLPVLKNAVAELEKRQQSGLLNVL